jgi:hypothetical protein
MIHLAGKLTVRQITGRKGAFAVGDFVSEVGTFKVKDPILDQFEEGEYRGTFHVERIYPDSYIYFGRVVTEIRAQMSGFELDEEVVPASPAAPTEPDPADREANAAQASPMAMSAPIVDHAAPELSSGGAGDKSQSDDPDQALFGTELYTIVQECKTVKLDPTIDRTKFRQQRDRLKVLGYGFDAPTQSWNKLQ